MEVPHLYLSSFKEVSFFAKCIGFQGHTHMPIHKENKMLWRSEKESFHRIQKEDNFLVLT